MGGKPIVIFSEIWYNQGMFERDENIKRIKKALRQAGAYGKSEKQWCRFYRKIKRSSLKVAARHHAVKASLERILEECRFLTEMLSGTGALAPAQERKLAEILADLKKTGPGLDYEFLISKADQEFHTTLDSVVRLGEAYLQKGGDRLLLQSEAENLLWLTREGLEKEKPDLFRLACFYERHGDAELRELAYDKRLTTVEEIWDREFCQPILPALQKAEAGLGEKPEEILARLGKIGA